MLKHLDPCTQLKGSSLEGPSDVRVALVASCSLALSLSQVLTRLLAHAISSTPRVHLAMQISWFNLHL